MTSCSLLPCERSQSDHAAVTFDTRVNPSAGSVPGARESMVHSRELAADVDGAAPGA
jgi:hypothetical protein